MANRPPVPVSGDFPSNSMKSKEQAKKQAIVKKRSSVANVISEHSNEVKSYIIYDIIAPAVKDMISSIVKSALNALQDSIETSLYGAPRKQSYDRPSYTDYSSKSRYKKKSIVGSLEKASYNDPRVKPSISNFNDIPALKSKSDAEAILSEMISIINSCGDVNVRDYYEIYNKYIRDRGVKIEHEFTDLKWGWTDLDDADTYRAKDGYRISLPDPKPL